MKYAEQAIALHSNADLNLKSKFKLKHHTDYTTSIVYTSPSLTEGKTKLDQRKPLRR